MAINQACGLSVAETCLYEGKQTCLSGREAGLECTDIEPSSFDKQIIFLLSFFKSGNLWIVFQTSVPLDLVDRASGLDFVFTVMNL